jgi:hypothetical protein
VQTDGTLARATEHLKLKMSVEERINEKLNSARESSVVRLNPAVENPRLKRYALDYCRAHGCTNSSHSRRCATRVAALYRCARLQLLCASPLVAVQVLGEAILCDDWIDDTLSIVRWFMQVMPRELQACIARVYRSGLVHGTVLMSVLHCARLRTAAIVAV